MDEKKLLEKYTVLADNVAATVQIWSLPTENIPIYELITPNLGPGTEALISSLIDELAANVPIEIEDVTDTKKIEKLRQDFYSQIRKVVALKLPDQDKKRIDTLAGIILHRMYGLGFIEIILADNWLEEITINGSTEPISVYHKKYGWCKTQKRLQNEEEIYNFSSQIGRKVGREISSLNPIMDAHLLTGDRVASTLFPISTCGNTITIRRFARNPWTAVHFIDPAENTLSKEIAAFLWMAMQYELNILVAGGTASGKTSMLNSICCFIPPTQRIISIEDTREITLPENLHWNWVPMTSRNKNPEGQGEVTMLDLMVASLRMRPDRIIVGEVRRREQAEAMFEAMHTGHSVYCTIHADTAEQVKRRLIEPPISIPKQEVEALQLVLIQYRDRRKGIRRTLELAEILNTTDKELQLNYLYRWRPKTDAFEKVNESIRVIEDLNLHTGMTLKELNQDLKQKQNILQWMLDNNLKDIDDVGKVMRVYYKNQDELIGLVDKKKKPDFL